MLFWGFSDIYNVFPKTFPKGARYVILWSYLVLQFNRGCTIISGCTLIRGALFLRLHSYLGAHYYYGDTLIRAVHYYLPHCNIAGMKLRSNDTS